ncbi:hypothetical protein C0J52_11217 [Blattella germanica]|nr:hypothetical protein C0J52_11217 [Blattella germanica]
MSLTHHHFSTFTLQLLINNCISNSYTLHNNVHYRLYIITYSTIKKTHSLKHVLICNEIARSLHFTCYYSTILTSNTSVSSFFYNFTSLSYT